MKTPTTYFFFLFSVLVVASKLYAQDFFAEQRQGGLKKTEQAKPKLVEVTKNPVGIVALVKDTTAFQDWKAVPAIRRIKGLP